MSRSARIVFAEIRQGDLALDLLGAFVAGEDIQVGTGSDDHLCERFLLADQAVQAGRFLQAKGKGHMPLRVQVDQQGAAARAGQAVRPGLPLWWSCQRRLFDWQTQ